jgi:glycosyltransferase involved in cell wall biosynthesis
MNRGLATVFLVQRIGPYHHARLGALAAAGQCAVTAIEFRPVDSVYAWSAVEDCGEYERRQTRSRAELQEALGKLRPQVIVCVGYADPEINQAMAWALRRQVPLVVCSDSTRADEPRTWAKEIFKRRIVAAFAAALVAGSRARDYLAGLGLDGRYQFGPWDVVDNQYFERGADLSRTNVVAGRAKLHLPSRYFVCVARFVPKKNLPRLIDAFARYVRQAGPAAWSLVLSGAGPQEAELRRCVTEAGVEGRVHFPGFIQYAELPACYGLAGALVLPSLSDQWGLVVNEAMAAGLPVLVSARCGCASDLVREGVNGFSFEPENTEALAGCLVRMAEMDQAERAAMGQRSREIVSAYSPAAFAAGLGAAIRFALARPHSRASWPTHWLTRLLATRSVTPR